MTRLFLTGASGFIGSHVTRAALAAGSQVAALVMPGDPLTRLQDVVGQMTLIEGEMKDLPGLRPVLAKWSPEACIHLAWYVEPGNYQDSPGNLSCLAESLTLLQELPQIHCNRVVVAGTVCEYDTDAGFLREDSPTRPTTLYAASKLALNLLGQQLAAKAGFTLAWGRAFYLYGPSEDERRAVPGLIRSLLGRKPFPATLGEQIRDYLHVEDVASAFCTLADKGAEGTYNICSGNPVTMRALMETVEEIVGHPGLIHFGERPANTWDPPFVCGDNHKLRDLGWKPRYTLRSGLTQTIDWWKKTAR